jgi:hypothetical protein
VRRFQQALRYVAAVGFSLRNTGFEFVADSDRADLTAEPDPDRESDLSAATFSISSACVAPHGFARTSPGSGGGL